MACEYICDGCGKRVQATETWNGYSKPHSWFERSDDDGVQVACSRECIDRIAERTGKTRVILPV